MDLFLNSRAMLKQDESCPFMNFMNDLWPNVPCHCECFVSLFFGEGGLFLNYDSRSERA